MKFIFTKPILFVWFGVPCQSWSRARRFDFGPPPLRDDGKELWGRKGLSSSDQQKVNLGNLLLLATILMVVQLRQRNIAWIVENPWTSRCWLTGYFRALMASGAKLQQLDYCQFGMPWKRPLGSVSKGLHGMVCLEHVKANLEGATRHTRNTSFCKVKIRQEFGGPIEHRHIQIVYAMTFSFAYGQNTSDCGYGMCERWINLTFSFLHADQHIAPTRPTSPARSNRTARPENHNAPYPWLNSGAPVFREPHSNLAQQKSLTLCCTALRHPRRRARQRWIGDPSS